MSSDQAFTGSVPAIYDRYLGPLLFEPYAADLAARAAELAPHSVLETAAGTGIATRALADSLPGAALTVTDLNAAMLEIAEARVGNGRTRYEAVDATSLPFRDGDFDVVACQFGIMFYPDRVAGYREAKRVLAPGGTFLFNAWCSLDENPAPKAVHEAVGALFPDNPPGFLARTPYGHGSVDEIERDLTAAGFESLSIERVELPSRAPSCEYPAKGFVMGSPLRMEIEERAPGTLDEVADAVERAVAEQFGSGPLETTMAAMVVAARAP